MYTILVCDDEQDIVSALEIYLTAEGYRVLKAYNGKEALAVAAREEVHLILMDIMMPVMDGLTAMAQLRQTSNVPVILLTAKSEDTDKVLGLNVGADDYITKPFNPVELLARVRSQLRRYLQLGGGTVQPSTLVIGGIRLDDNAKAVTVDGENAALTPKEYDILRFLMKNAGTVFSPSEIYRRVWDDVPLNAAGAIAVHIRHLREKIEINPSEPRYIKVVWGKGYKAIKWRAVSSEKMAGQGLGQGRCLRADAGAGRSDRAGRHRHWYTGQLQRLSGRRRIPAADPVSGAVL